MKPSNIRPGGRTAGLLVALTLVAACAEDPVGQFEVEGAGSLAGQLFFDADNNGLFTPVGGDTLLVGVPIEIRQRGGSAVLASTTTDASGFFSVDGLPPGTHDVFVVTGPGTTGELVFCRNPLATSVFIDEQAFVSIVGRLGCVVSIAEAEEADLDATVTISGIVTAGQGTFRGDNAYVQDVTGGILIFGLPGAPGLELGDSVEITGVLDEFNGELEIVSPRVAPNITAGVAVPAPRVLTTAAIAGTAATSADIGRLVRVQAATVGAFSGSNGSIDDGSGAAIIRLDGNVSGVLTPASFETGKCYDVTGILGIFRGAPQLKPRLASDVVEVPCN